MLKDNLIMLRNIHGLSQEEVAEKLSISRQSYAKYEKGETIPDIEKCILIASLYNISLDSLVKTYKLDNVGMIPPAPKGKNIWGNVIINERGQIVIPKPLRDHFSLKTGDRLIILSDENGIALVKSDDFEINIKKAMEFASQKND